MYVRVIISISYHSYYSVTAFLRALGTKISTSNKVLPSTLFKKVCSLPNLYFQNQKHSNRLFNFAFSLTDFAHISLYIHLPSQCSLNSNQHVGPFRNVIQTFSGPNASCAVSGPETATTPPLALNRHCSGTKVNKHLFTSRVDYSSFWDTKPDKCDFYVIF